MNVAIIPARGGSTRIPRKNIKMFHGKPMIEYPIEAARKSGVFDRIIVSTDSPEIAEVALSVGVEVMSRAEELARNEVGTQEVVAEAVKVLDLEYTDIVCCIYPCAPLLLPDDLMEAVDILSEGHSTFVIPVGEWLKDPGQFYMGTAYSFMYKSLFAGTLMQIDERRAIDINTMEDWQLAEKRYEELKNETK